MKLIKLLAFALMFLLVIPLAACRLYGKDTAYSAKLWESYDGVMQKLDSCDDVCGESYSFEPYFETGEVTYPFAKDEDGQFTRELTLKAENGRVTRLCVDSGEYVETPGAIIGLYAVCIDEQRSKYIAMAECRDAPKDVPEDAAGGYPVKTFVYVIGDGEILLTDTLDGGMDGFNNGTLRMYRGYEKPGVTDLYELSAETEGAFDRIASVTKLGSVDEYITVNEITKAYTRNGAQEIKPCTVLKKTAVTFDSEGKKEAAYFIDARTGIGYCVPFENGNEEVMADSMRPFDIWTVSDEERYALAYPGDEFRFDISEWQAPSAELEKLEADFPMQLDIDGDGVKDSMAFIGGGTADGQDSVISVNGSRALCGLVPVSIGRLELLPGDGTSWFYVYGNDEAGRPYGKYTHIYRFAEGELERIGTLWGELFGRSGENGFVTAVHQDGGAPFFLAGYSFEPSAEEEYLFRMEYYCYAYGTQSYQTLTDFEAFSKDGRTVIPKGSTIELAREKMAPFSSVSRTEYFSWNGGEYFVFLDYGNKLNGGELDWNECVMQQGAP